MNSKYPHADQVWQRVLAPGPGEQQSLQMLLRQLSMDTAYLKRLARGNEGPVLTRLLQEYASQQGCLKGILKLTSGSLPRSVTGTLPDHSLRRCFDHGLQRLAAFQLRTADPVYGPVFRDLARQTETHCRLITELLGNDTPEKKRP